MRIISLACGVAFVFSSASADAHALKAHLQQEGKHVAVEVFYDDGTQAAGARVIVRDSQQTRVARGRTDSQGRWTFPLPSPGSYTLVADDGLGHLVTVDFSISAGTGIASGDSSSEHQPGALHVGTMPRGASSFRWVKAAIGLAVIGLLTAAAIIARRFARSRQRQ